VISVCWAGNLPVNAVPGSNERSSGMHLRRFSLISSIIAVTLLASFGVAGAASAQLDEDLDLDLDLDLGVATFTTTLLGENEVPGPGDPDGQGFAVFTLIRDEGLICYGLTAIGIEPATAAHIHEAPPDEAGPIVVPLEPPTTGGSGGCTEADPELIQAIIDNPSDYYANVHNEDYPAGALRGQLAE